MPGEFEGPSPEEMGIETAKAQVESPKSETELPFDTEAISFRHIEDALRQIDSLKKLFEKIKASQQSGLHKGDYVSE